MFPRFGKRLLPLAQRTSRAFDISCTAAVSAARMPFLGASTTVKRYKQTNATRAPKSVSALKNLPSPEGGTVVTVKAYYVARGIDVIRVRSKLYNSYPQEFHTKSVTIKLNEELNQYITVFNYGSCVFFNIGEDEQMEHLRRIKGGAVSNPVAEGLQHTENYTVIIHDELEKPSIFKAEHVNIRSLDSSNVAIVGTVMAQTVALDYYAEAADRMIEAFMRMNLKIEDGGNFDALDKHSLFKLVASNNTVITNVLSKLGIFEGSDAAWENADYYYTWEGLRKDFELDNRYRDLSLKLDIVKDNARFFLEMSHNSHSTKLEWVIIILIASEIVIGITGLVFPHLGH